VLERADEPYGIRLGGPDRFGNDRLHYPDLLVIDPRGRRLALVLELSAKGRERRELILGAYGADTRIDRVLYLAEATPSGRATARLVGGSAGRMGLADRVRVQLVRPFLGAGEEPRREAARAAAPRIVGVNAASPALEGRGR
jgi:hypothetical protein